MRTLARLVMASALCVMAPSSFAQKAFAQAGGEVMEKVQGVGGFFFRAKDPQKLAK